MRSKKELRSVLANWRAVIAGLNTLTEEEAKWCLDEELNGSCRKNVLMRLYGRFNRMRSERELHEIIEQVQERYLRVGA